MLDSEAGVTFVIFQLFHVFPATKALYPFESENGFGYGGPGSSWAGENMNIAYVIVTVYVIAIFTIKYMLSGENVKGYNVKEAWKWWILGLSVFSFCGSMRTVPHLMKNMYTKGGTQGSGAKPLLSTGGVLAALDVM